MSLDTTGTIHLWTKEKNPKIEKSRPDKESKTNTEDAVWRGRGSEETVTMI